jgi:hypothetical protein
MGVQSTQPDNPELRHTPTPWRLFTNPDGTKLVGIGAQDGEGILDCGFGVWAWNDPEGIANANLIVEAVNNHDRLTSLCESYKTQVEAGSIEIAALKSRVEELTKALEQIVNHPEEQTEGHSTYKVGWAFWHVQKIAASALSLEDRKC